MRLSVTYRYMNTAQRAGRYEEQRGIDTTCPKSFSDGDVIDYEKSWSLYIIDQYQRQSSSQRSSCCVFVMLIANDIEINEFYKMHKLSAYIS